LPLRKHSTKLEGCAGHRDLKPANVLIAAPGAPDRPPQVKLVDFGISTLAAREDKAEPIEQGPDPSAVMAAPAGTPMYMAPESTERRYSAQLAADIFSFGVMAFEVLTRELPFQSPPALVPPEALAEVPLLQTLCPDLPPPLVAVLQRCLLPDPNRRPTAEALAAALAGC
jgi:serine/threonine-protein kinase